MYDVSDYQGMNDKPGMYFRYTFRYAPLKTKPEESYEVTFYAFTEEDARAQFTEKYEAEPGKLIRRENW